MSLSAGTRIRLNGNVPWSERRGCEGVVVADVNGPGIYPCDKPDPYRVVVLLDDDPTIPRERRHGLWTCAVRTSDVEVIG